MRSDLTDVGGIVDIDANASSKTTTFVCSRELKVKEVLTQLSKENSKMKDFEITSIEAKK